MMESKYGFPGPRLRPPSLSVNIKFYLLKPSERTKGWESVNLFFLHIPVFCQKWPKTNVFSPSREKEKENLGEIFFLSPARSFDKAGKNCFSKEMEKN